MQLQLFSTSGCHLCELAEALLVRVCAEESIAWQLVEIADSDALLEIYGVRIPVVKAVPGGDELGWPFDEERLRTWLVNSAGYK